MEEEMRIVKPESKGRPRRKHQRYLSAPPPQAEASSPSPSDVKLLLVGFRSGETVQKHPDLQTWLREGWCVRSAVPRIVESGDTKLLVVLERPIFTTERARPPVAHQQSMERT
jgi:hypothetical protein